MKTILGLTLAALVASHAAFAEDVRIEEDVAYLKAGREEKLDLFFPPGHSKKLRAPAIVIIHGGGWVGGDKANSRERNIGTNLAKAGYVCASINYRLGVNSTEATFADKIRSAWPQNLHDCKTAVRFLRSRAAELGIDSERVGVIGGSAGGHLAAMVGYTAGGDGLDPDGPYGEFSCRVGAVVPLYGPQDLVARMKVSQLGDDPELLRFCRKVSSVSYVTPDDPATLILHGTNDKIVALKQSQLLAEACRKFGIEFQLESVARAGHSFHLQPAGHDLRPLVIGFFDRHLKGSKRRLPRELRRERFFVDKRPAFVIWPTKRRPGRTPWVLYAPTLGQNLPGHAEAWMFRQLLDAGIVIAGVDVGESFGNPRGRAIYSALHKQLVTEHGFDEKACLLARSRGGLMLYCWAADHPGKVRCIAGIYPVCDLASYPGLKRAASAYRMTETELADVLKKHNPVDRLQPLAMANIPIHHIHGDVDKVVPLAANSGLLAERYRAAGGSIELVIASGQGHNMWPGFFEHQPLVDFLLKHAEK